MGATSKNAASSPRESTVRDPWRKDFSQLSPAVRRAGRYAIQMFERDPSLCERMYDDTYLGAVWSLTQPLFDPERLQRLHQDWNKPDLSVTREEDEFEFLNQRDFRRMNKKLRNGAFVLQGTAGERMRAYLRQHFADLPAAMIRQLQHDDGHEPTHPAVRALMQCAGLDDLDGALLDFVEKLESMPHFRDFLRHTGYDSPRQHHAALQAALGCPQGEVQQRLYRQGTLRSLRLVQLGLRGCDLEDFLNADDLFKDILDCQPETAEDLLAMVMLPAPRAECALHEFPHLEREARRLSTVLKKAAARHVVGVNALFHGIPGTGKTQFALSLAEATGMTAYEVRTADEQGDGLSRKGRLGAYMLSQRMLRGRTDCFVIFDEVEDTFGQAGFNTLQTMLGEVTRARSDKGWMNRMLESNPVPAIWITNDTESIDAAALRRFLLPVAFTQPPRRVRRQIAQRHLGDKAVPAEVLDELAADQMLVPAQFGAARRLLDLEDDEDPVRVVREGLAASRQLMHGSALAPVRKSVTRFDVAYLNLSGGISAARIGEALGRKGCGSLCFYGAPGTGKTEFAHVLADALDRELVVRASSDLISPYVGQTEQNIARLFAEIDSARSVLLLDEVDSLLRDRRQARHAWEATQVNELLQQMERFPGIFIAATNLMEQIDAAALRRFDFKLQFKPLTSLQRIQFFAEVVLGDAARATDLPPAVIRKLDELDMLTPGDFANVLRQCELLGETLSATEFVRRLIVECRFKTGVRSAA